MSPPVGRTWGVSLVGMEAHLVDIEVLAVANVPAFVLVGLPDAALDESRDRIRAAFAVTGLSWPNKRVTVNLSPASLPKSGSGFDLGIAVGVLAACGIVAPERIDGAVHIGELGLDGRVRPVRGVLPAALAARRAGARRIVVPVGNVEEARLVSGIDVVPAASLAQLAIGYGAKDVTVPPDAGPVLPARPAPPPAAGDLSDVVGQAEARAALEIAAAGGHHLFMTGPPGTGKTMLAARLPTVLPDLEEAEALEVTALHSVAGTLDQAGGLIRRPPYEAPHHTATPAAIIGGGSGIPRPGAVSRAHLGVLFLDEAPEFSPRVLETLRQPLELGEVVIHRSAGAARYPARFQLVLAANPCPCGRATGKGLDCVCTPLAKRRYLGRLSGPLLDRIDISVEVGQVRALDVQGGSARESSAEVGARVARAREAQRARLEGAGWRLNSEVPGTWLRRRLGTTSGVVRELNRVLDQRLLSLRGVDRVLRVAWTVADLAGRETPGMDELDTAMALRGRGAA